MFPHMWGRQLGQQKSPSPFRIFPGEPKKRDCVIFGDLLNIFFARFPQL